MKNKYVPISIPSKFFSGETDKAFIYKMQIANGKTRTFCVPRSQISNSRQIIEDNNVFFVSQWMVQKWSEDSLGESFYKLIPDPNQRVLFEDDEVVAVEEDYWEG